MGWFTSSDKDENQENNMNNNNFFSNFSSNVSSVSRVCRPDPDDQNFMVCKIKETKTQRVNGEDVTKTEEREEKIQVNNNNNHQMSPFGRQAGPAFPQNFEQNEGFGPELEQELHKLNDFFRNPFGSFFNATGMPFGEIIREMDRMVGGFHDLEQYNQEAGSQFAQNPQQYQNPPQQNNFPGYPQQQNYGPPRPQYDYNFQKTPRNDKDIYDV